MVPTSLRNWFLIHCIVDIIFALPLFVAPLWFLGLFGWSTVDPLTSRLVAAALLGIGLVSFTAYKEDRDVYTTLLTLKLIWSGVAIIGLVWSIIEGAPFGVWIALVSFVSFFIIWAYFKAKLSK